MSQRRFVGNLSLASLLAAAVLTANASQAGAAVTLGQTAPAPNTQTCGSPSAFLQKSIATASPSYTVPTGNGVITSWSTQAVNSAGKQAELKLFEATNTPNSYLVVGQDGPHVLAAGVLNSFPARIPVQGGEILGLYYSTVGTGCVFDGVPGDTTTYYFGTIPSPPVGSTYTTNMTDANFRLNVSTLLEPDCDNDGFGDETQDTNLSTCAPGTIPPPAKGGPTCKGKPATIVGTNGRDARTGSQGRDVFVGLGGSDKLSGKAGNDLVCGGGGKDTLKGGKGKDSLLGQKGKDTLGGGKGKDICRGGKGNDTASKCEVEKSL
jgi:Ca2+-binding RTX toxin-like protein